MLDVLLLFEIGAPVSFEMADNQWAVKTMIVFFHQLYELFYTV